MLDLSSNSCTQVSILSSWQSTPTSSVIVRVQNVYKLFREKFGIFFFPGGKEGKRACNFNYSTFCSSVCMCSRFKNKKKALNIWLRHYMPNITKVDYYRMFCVTLNTKWLVFSNSIIAFLIYLSQNQIYIKIVLYEKHVYCLWIWP